LFERHGRRVRLTAEGAVLLPGCLAALAEIERLESVRRRISQARRIAIAAGPVTGSYLLPALIRAFSAEQPELLVDLLTAPTEDVMALVAAGKADFGVCGSLDRLPMPGRLRLSHWLEEPFSLYASGPGPVILAPPIVIYSIAQALGPVNLIRQRLEQTGVKEWEARYLPSADAVKGACIAGLGFALLPCRATILECRAGTMNEVAGYHRAVAGHVWICQPDESRPNADAEIFLTFLRREGERLTDALADPDRS
jgi:DNA-binding transcriptional LysR family regulator